MNSALAATEAYIRENPAPISSAGLRYISSTCGIVDIKVRQFLLLRVIQHDTTFLEMAKTHQNAVLHEISTDLCQIARKHNVIFLELCRLVIDLMKSNDIMLLQLKLHNPFTGHLWNAFFQPFLPPEVRNTSG